jgi:hypothetical protein
MSAQQFDAMRPPYPIGRHRLRPTRSSISAVRHADEVAHDEGLAQAEAFDTAIETIVHPRMSPPASRSFGQATTSSSR